LQTRQIRIKRIKNSIPIMRNEISNATKSVRNATQKRRQTWHALAVEQGGLGNNPLRGEI